MEGKQRSEETQPAVRCVVCFLPPTQQITASLVASYLNVSCVPSSQVPRCVDVAKWCCELYHCETRQTPVTKR